MAEAPKAPGCAICGKPVDPARKPFCSKRCADVDLSRWLKGAYVIAGEPLDEEAAARSDEGDRNARNLDDF